MKVLSLKQPYADLVIKGKKKIELRKWNTHFRGKFYIHASKIPDKKALKKFRYENSKLPLGYIIGKVKLVDVKKYKNDKEHKKDKNLHLASSVWGNYGFILKNPVRIKPIKAKGKLNFWEFKK